MKHIAELLTDKQRETCRFYARIFRDMEIEVGSPENGGHWYKWDSYYDTVTDWNSLTGKWETVKSTDYDGGKKRWYCEKFEAVIYELWKAGQPHTLAHAIAGYVLARDEYGVDVWGISTAEMGRYVVKYVLEHQ